MSLEKLAKLLEVDEVSLMHGSKGVALYVRIEKAWQHVTIDNEDMEDEGRLPTMAKHLLTLSDDINKSFGRRKSDLKKAPEPSRGLLSWEDVGGYRPWDNDRGQVQIQRQHAAYAQPRTELPPPSPEPTVAKSLPSRFHAIVEELGKL